MNKANRKIIEYLDKRIVSLRGIMKDYKHPDIRFIVWDTETRRFLKRIFGDDVLTDYLSCLNCEPSSHEMGFTEATWQLYRAIPKNFEFERSIETKKFFIRSLRVISLLKTLEKEVLFFQDKDIEKYTKHIRKYWKVKAGLTGNVPYVQGEIGKEERS